MELAKAVLEHRTIFFIEDLRTELDAKIRGDSEEIAIVGTMVQSTE
jgi:hypothetical protein